MSYSYGVASSEFAALCQSQVKLLSQGLGAIWSAVYLTEEVTARAENQLFLFTIYPQIKNQLPHKIAEIELPSFLQQVYSRQETKSNFLLAQQKNKNDLISIELEQANLATKQLILPLIHEEVMMGLLVTKREDRHWNQTELEQVRAIANTLAIARFLEKQAQWYKEQSNLQQEITRWQQQQFGNLLHQLRNPLTALRTFSKLLLKRLLPENRHQSLVQNILRQSDRLSDLIDRFAEKVDDDLETSLPVTLSTTSVRLSETEVKQNSNFLLPGNGYNLDILNIAEILEPLLTAQKAIAESKKIDLIVKIPDCSLQVRANAGGLREVLTNLLDNAIKYTPEKGQVTVRIERDEVYLGIAIEDTGYGIPEADRKHLFERHYRGIQAQGNIPGTGLGLAIAKQLIEQMQGKIKVISPNERSNNSSFPGTIFTVWLLVIDN